MKITYLLIAGLLITGVSLRADDVIEKVMEDGFKGKESIAVSVVQRWESWVPTQP